MDAIVLLEQDHRTVESLFKQFEALGERAQRAKRKVAQKIIRALAMHVFEASFRADDHPPDARLVHATRQLIRRAAGVTPELGRSHPTGDGV